MEKEIEELKGELANKPTEVVDTELVEENENLKEQLAVARTHSEESEKRLMAEIDGMENGDFGGCLVFTPDEYKDYSAAQGKIYGRKPNQKTECTIEELRALINSDWSPAMVMEKHGMTEGDLQQLIWKLSKEELRDNAIKLNFKRDQFGREG